MYLEIILPLIMILFLGLVIAKLPTDVIRKGRGASGGIKISKGKKSGRYAHRHKDSRKKDSESKPRKRKRTKSRIPFSIWGRFLVWAGWMVTPFGEKEMPVKVYKKKGEIIQCGEYQLIAGEDICVWTRKNGVVIQIGDDGGFVDENGNVFGSRSGFIRHQKMVGKSGSRARAYYRILMFKPKKFVKTNIAKLKLWTDPMKWKSEYISLRLKMGEHRVITVIIGVIIGVAIMFLIGGILSTLVLIPIVGISIHAGERVDGVVYADDYTDNGTNRTVNAIQLAINDMRIRNEAAVYIGPGIWNGGVADNLVIDGNTSTLTGVQLIGAGVDKTVLNFTINGDDAIKFTQSGSGVTRVYRVVVKDLSVLGTVNSNHGINFDFTFGLTVERVRVRNFTKAGSYGLYYNACYRTIQIESSCQNCANGIYTAGSNTIEIIGGSIISCLSLGIYLNAHATKVCTNVSGCAGGGIQVQGASNNTLEACYFEGNTDFDILLQGTPDIPVQNMPQLGLNNRLEGNYHNGWKAGVIHTTNGVRVTNSFYCDIVDGTYVNQTGAAIQIGYDPGDDNKCFSIRTHNNWTGDIWGASGQWGWKDTTLIDITTLAYYTEVEERRFMGIVTDNGHFTVSPGKEVKEAYNTSATLVCPGDPVMFDTSVSSGRGVTPVATAESKLCGVVYDGGVDTLGSDILAGNATIDVDDVWLWWMMFKMGFTLVQVRDDLGNTEHMTISSVDTAAGTMTFTGNLVNAHTVANNTRLLVEFGQNDYFTMITKGTVEYLHVDGNRDVAVGSYIGQSSSATVGYKGIDNFVAIALEVYAGNNQNGLIRAEAIPLKRSVKIICPFSFGAGGVTEGYKGWNITGAGRNVSGFAHIPEEVGEVLGMDIWGEAAVTEADRMLLEIRFYAGGDNEAWNTHTQNYANHQSETSNFVAGDNIYWRVVTGNFLDVGGNDNVKLIMWHEAVVAPDIDTQCHLTGFVIYCI